jgi:predicted DNA-binding antitoxin AbrB/MazE fold protein
MTAFDVLGGRVVQPLQIEAVYEQGLLRLPRELPLERGQKVLLTIHPAGGAVRRLCGLIRWPGDREELTGFLDNVDEGVLGDHDVR